ncbi:MAG: efflux RND transporter periplasmic adaptor subunit [Candidatus Moranbacteria bacterium]|nr:efflux RND transporter periplasmic adaptor subunit [Candidatus Moranbacteria bacterium]
MSKKIIFTIVGILIVSVVILLWRSRKLDQQYENDIVTIGNVSKTINVDATLQPNIYVDISTELPTLINWVGVKINDEVKKGQEVLRLDKKSINAQIRNAQLAVERAELAEKQSRRKWDDLKPEERESIKKASEQSRQTLNEIYAQASKTSITSSIDGVVTKQNAQVGEVASGVLLRIIDLNSLQVEALIPEIDISKIYADETVYITFDAYPEKEIKGKVKLIEIGNINLQGNTYYKAIIKMDNVDDIVILDGMNIEVDIEFASKNNVLVIPRDFATKDDKGYFVHTTDSSNKNKEIFVKQYFEAGLIGDEKIEIISGLSKGQNIMKLIEEDK